MAKRNPSAAYVSGLHRVRTWNHLIAPSDAQGLNVQPVKVSGVMTSAKIMGSSCTGAAHGITALDAISSAIADKPWLPPLPAIARHQFTTPREWTPRSLPGAAVLEVGHAKPGRDRPDDGRTIGQLAVPDTGGKYRRADVPATRELAAGPGDLDLVRRGAQRLSSFRIGTP